MGRKALVIGRDETWSEGGRSATPDGYAAGGLGALLDRIAAGLDREATVIFDAHAAAELALPVTPDELTDVMDAHPCAEEARAAGWTVSAIGPWSTFTRDGRAIEMAVHPLMEYSARKKAFERGSCPLLSPSKSATAAAFAEWHRLTGSAYAGTPGTAGLSILAASQPRGKGQLNPTWKPKQHGPSNGAEDDYQVDHWRARRAGTRWAHSYDLNRAYVGTCAGLMVCPWELKRTGRMEFNPRDPRAGWYEVELAPWNIDYMPDPAGYDPLDHKKPRRVRWLTMQTVALLHELTELRVYGGIRVLDSWTGPARPVLKPWQTRMRDAWRMLDSIDDSDVRARVELALKTAGRETLGLLGRASNWAYRPDWWAAVIAGTRANLWRRAWKIGGGLNGPGPWPLWFDVDNIWYGSDLDDPREAAPEGLPLSPVDGPYNLGEFKPKHSKRSRRV